MSQGANFQVFQASAGSGKTYTIVKEYLKLCLKSERQVDNFRHILAITFTNAAANEMKAKIVNHLCEIIASKSLKSKTMESDLVKELGIGETELRRNAQLLLTRIIHDYSSFCVSTIDAFVQKLSRAFARDLGLPSQYTVSIDSAEVADTIAENIALEISDDNPFLVQLLMDFSENRFANNQSNNLEFQLTEFVEKLMSEKAYQKEENNHIQNAAQYKQTLDFLNDRMLGFENDIKKAVEQFKLIAKRYHLETEDFAYGKNGFVAYVNKLANKVYEAPSARFKTVVETEKWYSATANNRFQDADLKQIGNEIQQALRPLLDCCEQRLGQFLFYKSQRDLLYLYALRTKIRTEFERLAQEDEVVHISEFNKLLNRVMGDFSVPFVYERIGEHFQHVFVDEFQDTSVLQWQNLLPLIDNGLSAGRMSMVVGDGKQSIYRFRSGEVEQIVQLPEIYALPTDEREDAFKQYEQNLVHEFSFQRLGSNFRSYDAVVQFNNAFFEKSFKLLSEALQKVYKDKDARLGKDVSISQMPEKKEQGLVQVELYDAENQPDYYMQRIEALVQELTHKGYRLSDIAILVNNSKLGLAIANHLNDKGIAVLSKDSILLKSSDKVQLLVNTLRYLIHGDNEVDVANVLYYRHLTQNPAFDGQFGNLFEPVKSIVRGMMPIETALGLGEAGLLSSALAKSTCLYDLCCSLLRIYQLDTLRDAFLNYFLEEVFKYQMGIKEGIQEFLDFWEQKKDQLSVRSASSNALTITTIHKSKGLEYEVVIYPEAITDLDEKQKNIAAEVWVRPEELGFEPIPNLEKVLFKMVKSAEAMGEESMQLIGKERESHRLDNLNLLYVAFTRAKQRLYVMARQGKGDKENVVMAFVEDAEININKVSVKTEGEGFVSYRYGDADFCNPKSVQDIENEVAERIDSMSGDWFSKIEVDSAPSMYWASPEDKMKPREWGDMVHKILSGIQTEKDIDSALQPCLLDGTLDKEMMETLKDRFLQMARHPLLALAFGEEAKVKNECEILCDHEILRPDRYAELSDCIYLLDYKTGKKDEAHRMQLKNYIYALQGMVKKEIRAFLVYLSDSIEVEAVTLDTLF